MQDLGIDNKMQVKISEKIRENFKMLDYCRALHAEENAIRNVARFGSSIALRGAVLYTTTYPCNLCANKCTSRDFKSCVS